MPGDRDWYWYKKNYVQIKRVFKRVFKGNLKGDSKGDLQGDFKQDLEGDLLSCSGHFRSGLSL